MSRARGLQLYALLLRLYPKASLEYEAGMIEMFALRPAEAAQRKNAPGQVWLVIRELGGLTVRPTMARSYSARSALTGSTAAARRAGRNDAVSTSTRMDDKIGR